MALDKMLILKTNNSEFSHFPSRDRRREINKNIIFW